MRQRRLHQGFAIRRAGHVAGLRAGAVTGGEEFPGQRLGVGLLQVADHHRRAGGGEQFGDGAADPGARAGDDGHLPL